MGLEDFLKDELQHVLPIKLGGKSEASGTAGTGGAETGPSATSATPTSSKGTGRTLLIHGYSASGADLAPWRDALEKAGIDTAPIAIGNYVTLNNEVTIKDLGEAFDRALRLTPWSDGSKDDSWTFDAIVHSTGMLVLRQWLASDPFPRDDPRSRIRRLKHLVGLAPATFGSPQAREGRSWLGALIKGTRPWGPTFSMPETRCWMGWNWPAGTHGNWRTRICCAPARFTTREQTRRM